MKANELKKLGELVNNATAAMYIWQYYALEAWREGRKCDARLYKKNWKFESDRLFGIREACEAVGYNWIGALTAETVADGERLKEVDHVGDRALRMDDID